MIFKQFKHPLVWGFLFHLRTTYQKSLLINRAYLSKEPTYQKSLLSLSILIPGNLFRHDALLVQEKVRPGQLGRRVTTQKREI